MRIQPTAGGCSIVLVGPFTPTLFSPFWLAAHNLCSKQEAEAAAVTVITAEYASLRVGAMTIQAHSDRISVETTEAPWIVLADFFTKLLHDVLPETPVTQIGINRMVHFGVGSEERRTRIGRRLAPLEPWGAWKSDLERDASPLRSGMRSLIMQETKIPSGLVVGYVQARVEPSVTVPGNSAVFVAVNDHYQLESPASATDSSTMLDVLQTGFESSIQRSEWIVDQIMALSEAANQEGKPS